MGAKGTQYENVMELARAPDPEVRLRLASDAGTPAEILYFLAEDASREVRRAVAENPTTPRQAHTILSHDTDYTVRCLLANRIVGDGLPEDERSQLWRTGFTILETLARDSLVRVRRTLAEAIMGEKSAPRAIILQLANDPERDVADPILRNSPVLTDDDLVDIASGDAPDWAKSAIAERETVEAEVSKAIVAKGTVPTVTRLLKNKRAVIDDHTIERVVDDAPEIEEWHEPLVTRPSLPVSAIMKLARFVASSLLTALRSRKELDPHTATDLDEAMWSRGGAVRRSPAKSPSNSAARYSGKSPTKSPSKAPVK